jgi:hypothetical protein
MHSGDERLAWLKGAIGEAAPMEVEGGQQEPADGTAAGAPPTAATPEIRMYLELLTTAFLIDTGRFAEAAECSASLVSLVSDNRRCVRCCVLCVALVQLLTAVGCWWWWWLLTVVGCWWWWWWLLVDTAAVSCGGWWLPSACSSWIIHSVAARVCFLFASHDAHLRAGSFANTHSSTSLTPSLLP